MSLSLAKTWVRTAIQHSAAQAEALRLLDRAATSNSEATLIAGCKLTGNGRTYLGRWDGRELVVLELPDELQRIWGIDPQGLFQQVDAPAIVPPVVTEIPVITISDAHADEQLSYGANTPLSGTCQYEFDRPYSQAMRRCALRAEYFGPNLPRQHTAMSYIDEPIPRPRGTFRFRFAPPLIWDGPKDLAGTLLIFLQMFDAEDWAKNVGTRRISNVTFMVATLRPSA